MVAWGWLIVVFFFGFVGGMFLTALMKANDPYDGTEEAIDKDFEIVPAVIMRNEQGQLVKQDKYGIAIYDPETGEWRSLN